MLKNMPVRMTKKQQYLVEDNIKLMYDYLRRKKFGPSLPKHLADEFESDLGWYFCYSALGYDKKMGFQFSTYVYGGFKFCWKNMHVVLKKRFNKNNYCDSQTLRLMAEEQNLRREARDSHIDKNAVCLFIDDTKLTVREKMITMAYFFEGGTVRSIGKMFKVSGARIHQELEKIKRKLKRTAIRQKLDRSYFYIR